MAVFLRRPMCRANTNAGLNEFRDGNAGARTLAPAERNAMLWQHNGALHGHDMLGRQTHRGRGNRSPTAAQV